jgi:hypothetical protein
LPAAAHDPGGLRQPRPASAPAGETVDSPSWRFLREKYDADGDGRIASGEYPRSARGFANLDADGDGWVTARDFDAQWDGFVRVPDFVWGEGGPELGDVAPPFALPATSGATVSLGSFRGKTPVVLVFGSFT